jgi:hypothetical protein
MSLYGFALLPKKEVQEKIISFRKKYSDVFFGPMLSLSENLPHVSILQCPFFVNMPVKSIIKMANENLHPPITLKWENLIYQPVGWVFANIYKTPSLSALQMFLLENCEKYIDYSMIDQHNPLKGYNEREKEYYLKYGYRYIGDEYKPHVTIGRIDESTQIPENAVLDFKTTFSESEIEFDRIAYYEAGKFGAAKKILF